MRIVITGAKGYVGSVCSLRAIERGHEVIALDDESRGLNPIEHKIGSSYKVFNCMDGIKGAVEGPVDIVIHFAAATGSLERPLDELRAFNVGMMEAVYRDARELGAKAFLWPTTSLAIGVPDSPYVMSKEEGLAKLKEADVEAGISVPVRFFNVTGAYKGLTELRKNEVHILPTMLQCYQERKDFIINGSDYETKDGSPSRDLVNVLDVVEYLLDIAEAKASKGTLPDGIQPHPSDGAIWLGKRESTTVLEMISVFEQWFGKLQARFGPRRAFDCGELLCDEAQAAQFRRHRGGLMPAWGSIRDEFLALEDALEANRYREASGEIVVSVEQPVMVKS